MWEFTIIRNATAINRRQHSSTVHGGYKVKSVSRHYGVLLYLLKGLRRNARGSSTHSLRFITGNHAHGEKNKHVTLVVPVSHSCFGTLRALRNSSRSHNRRKHSKHKLEYDVYFQRKPNETLSPIFIRNYFSHNRKKQTRRLCLNCFSFAFAVYNCLYTK